MYMRIQKVSQIDLVKYIDELDEKLNNKKVRDILYNEYLKSTGKNTRKTKTDKRYVVIAALTRDNFRTQIGDTTVWRVLKVKKKSKKIFEEMKDGDIAIKEAYYKAYPVEQKKKNDVTSDGVSGATVVKTGESNSTSVKITNHKAEQISNNSSLNFSSDDEILDMIKMMKVELEQNMSNHLNNTRLREIDGELFALRKVIAKIMEYNDQDDE